MSQLDQFIKQFRLIADATPDQRTGQNIHYPIGDIVMTALAVFLMQSASWLEFQKKFRQAGLPSNLQTLFSCDTIPCDNQVRKVLDGVDPNQFQPMLTKILNLVEQNPVFNNFSVLDGRHLIAVDGTEYHNSNLICCENCFRKYHKSNDIFEYIHIGVAFTLCTYHQTEVIPLYISTVNENRALVDKNTKQDTEVKAFKRYIDEKYNSIEYLKPIFLLDAIYGNHPVLDKIKSLNNASYIVTCKEGSQKNIFDYIKGAKLETKESIYINKVTNKKYKRVMSWMIDVPIRNTKDAILTNYISMTETFIPNNTQLESLNKKASIKHKDKKGIDLIKSNKFCFITDIIPTQDNIETLFLCARNRWRIENGFNSLKKRGFNFEHNFGHGKKTLSAVLAILILIAFSIHTWSQVLDTLNQAARRRSSSNECFISEISTLSKYVLFKSFKQMLTFMASGEKIPIPERT